MKKTNSKKLPEIGKYLISAPTLSLMMPEKNLQKTKAHAKHFWMKKLFTRKQVVMNCATIGAEKDTESCEPFVPHFKIAVIGVGQRGCAALQQHQRRTHDIFGVDELYFCKEPFSEMTNELADVIENYPILFWLVDLHDLHIRKAFEDCMERHRRRHAKESLSICVLYQSQKAAAKTDLAEASLIILVEDSLPSLALIPEMLLDELSQSGLVGIDLFDVFSVLRSCRSMHYFRRSGKSTDGIDSMLHRLKKDVNNILPSPHPNGIVSIRTDATHGMETVDQVIDALSETGCWVNQLTFLQEASEQDIGISLLLGR